jgi:mannose-6-phosphate isomerase-like protein (cupin superfamily)
MTLRGFVPWALFLVGCASTAQRPPLHYRQITLTPESVEQPLLDGPPQTAGMRSGRVVLKTGEHMHRHSTNANEELLVILQGKGRVIIGGETLRVEGGQVLYIPPRTEHELHNDDGAELRYIYTVAPAAK